MSCRPDSPQHTGSCVIYELVHQAQVFGAYDDIPLLWLDGRCSCGALQAYLEGKDDG